MSRLVSSRGASSMHLRLGRHRAARTKHAMSETTPWWRQEAATRRRGRRGGDAACSISTSETVRREDGHGGPSHGANVVLSPSPPPPPDASEIRPVFLFFPQVEQDGPDENGVMRRKCERIIKKLFECVREGATLPETLATPSLPRASKLSAPHVSC